MAESNTPPEDGQGTPASEPVPVLQRFSLERWLRRNLDSHSAVRKLAAGAVKALTEVLVSLALARLTLLVLRATFGPVPVALFAVLPGDLTVGGVFFGLYYYGGIKDLLGPD